MTTETKMNRSKGPEVLAYFATIVADELGKIGLPEKEKTEVAINVMERMRFEFGGQLIYFPKNVTANADARNNEIYGHFMRNELTIPELSFKYGISAQMVYRAIASVRARNRAEHDTRAAESV